MSIQKADQRPLRLGLILMNLDAQYPDWLMWKLLRRTIQSFYSAITPADSTREMLQDLRYLEEKGLLVSRVQVAQQFQLKSFRLTTDGRDVARGHVEHPGIEIVTE